MRKISILFACTLLLPLLPGSNAVASNPIDDKDQESAYEDSRFYLAGTANAQTAFSVNASAGIFNVAIGAGYFLSPRFSIEAGGTYNNLTFDSSDEVGGGSLGGFATLVFHKSIGGNLKYIPQLQTQYSHIFVEQYRFNFLEVGLAPLAFEYRADDSSLGVTASIGSLGVAFPLSDTADTFKPSYTLNLNSVSLGLVFYF